MPLNETVIALACQSEGSEIAKELIFNLHFLWIVGAFFVGFILTGALTGNIGKSSFWILFMVSTLAVIIAFILYFFGITGAFQ